MLLNLAHKHRTWILLGALLSSLSVILSLFFYYLTYRVLDPDAVLLPSRHYVSLAILLTSFGFGFFFKDKAAYLVPFHAFAVLALGFYVSFMAHPSLLVLITNAIYYLIIFGVSMIMVRMGKFSYLKYFEPEKFDENDAIVTQYLFVLLLLSPIIFQIVKIFIHS